MSMPRHSNAAPDATPDAAPDTVFNLLSHAATWLGKITLAATFETLLHPLDTLIKRLINNKNPLYNRGLSLRNNASNLHRILFVDASGQGAWACSTSLLRGISAALPYRILQRCSLRLQPELKKKMEQQFQTESLWVDLASSIPVGTLETLVLAPFDFKRTRAQTLLKGATTASPPPSLFTGLSAAVLRNTSFLAASSVSTKLIQEGLMQQGILGSARQDQNGKAQPNNKQKHASRSLGYFTGMLISSPWDVMKVRMQASSGTPLSLSQTGRTILKQEGGRAFFRGFFTKAAMQSCRMTFFMGLVDRMLAETPAHTEKQTVKPRI